MERLWKHYQIYNHDLNLDECGRQEFYPNQKYEYKVYQNFIIHYIDKGTGFLEIDGQEYELEENQGFILRRGMEAKYYASNNTPWSYYWVGLSGKHLTEYLERSTLLTQNIFEYKKDSQLIDSIIKINELAFLSEPRANEDIEYKQLIYKVLLSLCDDYPNNEYNQSMPTQRHYAEIAYDYINTNFNKKITVATVADYIGISRSYLYRLFKERFDESPQNLLMTRRIDLSRHLLSETNSSVGEIAQKVGYDDQFLFSKNFKKRVNMSPSKYRKLNDRR